MDRTKKKNVMEEARITFVLTQFQYMGMDPQQRPSEEMRLRNDPVYYEEWCTYIHEWCTPCPEEFLPADMGDVVVVT